MTRKKKSVLKVVLSPPLKKSQLKASPSRPVPGVTGVRTRTGAAASPTTSSAKMKKGLPASREKGTLKTYSASKTGKAITPGKLSAEDAVTTVKADTAEKPSSAKQRLETPKKDVAGGKSMANQPQKAEVEKKMIRPSTSQHIVRGMAKVPGAATVITVTPPRKDKTGLKQAVTESASMESSSVCQPSKIIWSKAQPLSPGKMGNGQIIRINLMSPEVSSLPVSPSAGSSISVLRSNPQKSIQCLDCMLILPNLEELNKHKHVCKKTIPTKIFSCFTCNTCFRSRDELNEHRRSMHLGLTVDNKQKVILQKQAAELAEMRSTARKALTGRDGGGSALSPSTMSAIQKAVDEVYAQKIEGSSPVTVSMPSPCKSAPMKLVLKAPFSNKGKMLVIPIKTGEDPDIQVKAHLEKLAASSLYKCGEKTQMISVKPKADQKVVKGEISTSESKEQAAVKAQVAKADFTETAVASAQTSTTVSVTRRQMASHPAKSKTLKASGAVKPKHTNEQKEDKEKCDGAIKTIEKVQTEVVAPTRRIARKAQAENQERKEKTLTLDASSLTPTKRSARIRQRSTGSTGKLCSTPSGSRLGVGGEDGKKETSKKEARSPVLASPRTATRTKSKSAEVKIKPDPVVCPEKSVSTRTKSADREKVPEASKKCARGEGRSTPSKEPVTPTVVYTPRRMVTRSVKTEVASAKSSYKSPELDRTSQRKMRKGANTELDSAALPDSPILTRKRKVETDEEPQSPPIKGKAKKSGKRGGDGDMEVVEVGCGDGTTKGQIAGRTRLVKFTRRLTQSPDNTKSSEPTDSCYTCNGDEKGKSSQEQKLEVSPKNDEKKGRIVKKETSQAGKKIPGKAKGAASPSASQAPKRKLADDDNEVTFPKMSKMLQDKDRSSVAAETKLKVDTKSGKEVKQPRTTGAQPVAKSVSGKEVGRVVVSSKGQPVLKGVRKILPKPAVVAPVVEVLKLGMDSTRTAPIQAENPREASMSTTPPVINSEDDGQQGVKKSDEFMQCPGCNLLFTSTLSLAAHRRYRCPVRLSDDQLGAFICLCGLGFATKEELEKHNVTEREIGRHPRSEKNRCRMICNCLDCGQPFHRSQLSSHKRECTKLMNVYTRTFWCKHCTAFKTTSALQMKRHVAAYHPDAPEEDHTLFKSDTELEKMDEKGAPPKMCLDCGETFLGAAFKAHKRDGCSMEGSSKVYSCFECHKMFNTRKELDEHKKTLHTVSGAFVCGFCHETFNVYVDLRQHHEKVHSKTAKVPPKVISDLLQNLKKGSCEPPQMTYPSGAAPQVSMSSSADAKGMNIMVGDEGNGFEISIDTSNPAGPAVRVNKKQVLDMPAAKEVAPLKSAAELTECELDTLKKLKSSLEQEKKHKPAILRRKSTSKRGMKSKELIEPTLVKGPVKNIRMQGPGAANADSSRSSQGFVSIPNLPGVRMLVPVGKDKMVCLQCQCTLDSVTDIASHKCPSSGRKMMVKAEAAASPEKKDWSMKPLPLAKAKKRAKTGEEGQEDDEEVEWFEATTN